MTVTAAAVVIHPYVLESVVRALRQSESGRRRHDERDFLPLLMDTAMRQTAVSGGAAMVAPGSGIIGDGRRGM